MRVGDRGVYKSKMIRYVRSGGDGGLVALGGGLQLCVVVLAQSSVSVFAITN